MGDSINSIDQARDELQVVRCQLGEWSAFEDLVQAWSARLLRHLRRTVGPDLADDVAQEVWIRALRGIVRLRQGAKLGPWLFGIAHNVAMDRLRVRYAESAALAAMTEDPPPEIDHREPLFDLLDEQLALLPIVERETLTLFYLEELSLGDVAEVQSVPVGTVKSRLFRARRMLREAMLKGSEHAA